MSDSRSDDAREFADFYLGEDRARHYHDKYGADRGHRVSNRVECRSVDELLALAEAEGDWLDVPSGAGRFRSTIEGRGIRYFAADASPAMLALARQARSGDPDDSAPAVRVDARRLPFDDRAFDGVACLRFVHHFEDPRDRVAVLQELARVARRHVIVSFFDAMSFQAARRRVRAMRGRRSGRHAQSRRAFCEEAGDAGLRVVRIRHRARLVSEWAVALLEVEQSAAREACGSSQ